MASDCEASSCEKDPNFAVICAFLEKFGANCGLSNVDFLDLQKMLENTEEVPQVLIDLHVKLMRKARKSISNEKWEKAIIKLCHSFCTQDAWEIERFGYKKAKLSSKLRILKELLEMQFDYNNRFKTEINKMSADELRSQPLGRDKLGHTYWFLSDDNYQIRVFKEDADDEAWKLVAKDKDSLLALISELNDGEIKNSPKVIGSEDTNNSLDNPSMDTGQHVNADENSLPNTDLINVTIGAESNISNNINGKTADTAHEQKMLTIHIKPLIDSTSSREQDPEDCSSEHATKKVKIDKIGIKNISGGVAKISETIENIERSGIQDNNDSIKAVPIISDEIVEDTLYFYGEGNGVDNSTGNESKPDKDDLKPEDSKPDSKNLEVTSYKNLSENIETKSGSIHNEQTEGSASPMKHSYKLGTVLDTKTDKILASKFPIKKSRWDVETSSTEECEPSKTNITHECSEDMETGTVKNLVDRWEQLATDENKSDDALHNSICHLKSNDSKENCKRVTKNSMFFFGPGSSFKSNIVSCTGSEKVGLALNKDAIQSSANETCKSGLDCDNVEQDYCERNSDEINCTENHAKNETGTDHATTLNEDTNRSTSKDAGQLSNNSSKESSPTILKNISIELLNNKQSEMSSTENCVDSELVDKNEKLKEGGMQPRDTISLHSYEVQLHIQSKNPNTDSNFESREINLESDIERASSVEEKKEGGTESVVSVGSTSLMSEEMQRNDSSIDMLANIVDTSITVSSQVSVDEPREESANRTSPVMEAEDVINTTCDKLSNSSHEAAALSAERVVDNSVDSFRDSINLDCVMLQNSQNSSSTAIQNTVVKSEGNTTSATNSSFITEVASFGHMAPLNDVQPDIDICSTGKNESYGGGVPVVSGILETGKSGCVDEDENINEASTSNTALSINVPIIAEVGTITPGIDTALLCNVSAEDDFSCNSTSILNNDITQTTPIVKESIKTDGDPPFEEAINGNEPSESKCITDESVMKDPVNTDIEKQSVPEIMNILDNTSISSSNTLASSCDDSISVNNPGDCEIDELAQSNESNFASYKNSARKDSEICTKDHISDDDFVGSEKSKEIKKPEVTLIDQTEESNIKPVYVSEKKPEEALVEVVDVTNRKKIEQTLQTNIPGSSNCSLQSEVKLQAEVSRIKNDVDETKFSEGNEIDQNSESEMIRNHTIKEKIPGDEPANVIDVSQDPSGNDFEKSESPSVVMDYAEFRTTDSSNNHGDKCIVAKLTGIIQMSSDSEAVDEPKHGVSTTAVKTSSSLNERMILYESAETNDETLFSRVYNASQKGCKTTSDNVDEDKTVGDNNESESCDQSKICRSLEKVFDVSKNDFKVDDDTTGEPTIDKAESPHVSSDIASKFEVVSQKEVGPVVENSLQLKEKSLTDVSEIKQDSIVQPMGDIVCNEDRGQIEDLKHISKRTDDELSGACQMSHQKPHNIQEVEITSDAVQGSKSYPSVGEIGENVTVSENDNDESMKSEVTVENSKSGALIDDSNGEVAMVHEKAYSTNELPDDMKDEEGTYSSKGECTQKSSIKVNSKVTAEEQSASKEAAEHEILENSEKLGRTKRVTRRSGKDFMQDESIKNKSVKRFSDTSAGKESTNVVKEDLDYLENVPEHKAKKLKSAMKRTKPKGELQPVVVVERTDIPNRDDNENTNRVTRRRGRFSNDKALNDGDKKLGNKMKVEGSTKKQCQKLSDVEVDDIHFGNKKSRRKSIAKDENDEKNFSDSDRKSETRKRGRPSGVLEDENQTQHADGRALRGGRKKNSTLSITHTDDELREKSVIVKKPKLSEESQGTETKYTKVTKRGKNITDPTSEISNQIKRASGKRNKNIISASLCIGSKSVRSSRRSSSSITSVPSPQVVSVVDCDVAMDNSSDMMEIQDQDPLAVSETEPEQQNPKVATLSSLSLDFSESPTPSTRRSLRKRGIGSPETVQSVVGINNKKATSAGKRTIDLQLRESIEEKKKEHVSSSEDDARGVSNTNDTKVKNKPLKKSRKNKSPQKNKSNQSSKTKAAYPQPSKKQKIIENRNSKSKR